MVVIPLNVSTLLALGLIQRRPTGHTHRGAGQGISPPQLSSLQGSRNGFRHGPPRLTNTDLNLDLGRLNDMFVDPGV